MKKIIFSLLVVAFLSIPQAVFSAQEEGAAPAINSEEAVSKISKAASDNAIVEIVDDTLSGCRSYDDYEKFAAGLKGLIAANPKIKHMNALCYCLAKIRWDQLMFLSQQNDIESGRLYMNVNEAYRNEALEYLDKAAHDMGSKDLLLDIYFLQFLIAKESFQQKSEVLLDGIAKKIATYSDNSSINKDQLNRIIEKFNKKRLPDYALKLKVMYASKIDTVGAQEIFEDIKSNADHFFLQGNLKQAAILYDQYMREGQPYFKKEAMAANVMDIAEKYFNSGRYKDANKYYEFYKEKYPDSKILDYCSYKMALSFYNDKDYMKATALLENFLATYQASVWFDKAFETLCKIYYMNYPKDKAIIEIKRLIANYYRKNTGDYAWLLIGMLQYSDKGYNDAFVSLKKIEPASVYAHAADMINSDIKEIRKTNSLPAFARATKDTYYMWEPYTAISATIMPASIDSKPLNITYNENGMPCVEVKPGENIKFTLDTLEDVDKFAEYLQDKDDMSRLPKKLGEGTKRDLISVEWGSGGGKFTDEKQTKSRAWQAPAEAGTYRVSVRLDDLSLVRPPDKGTAKDQAKELSVMVVVK